MEFSEATRAPPDGDGLYAGGRYVVERPLQFFDRARFEQLNGKAEPGRRRPVSVRC